MTLDEVRRICLAFPYATEDLKWETNLTFCVGTKMFAITGTKRSEPWLSFKCSPGEFQELIERDGVRPAPYLARAFWVSLDDSNALTTQEIRRLVAKSYQMVFATLTKKVREELAAD